MLPSNSPSDAVSKCAVACGDTGSCTHWTLRKSDEKCYLFDRFNFGLNRYTDKTDWTSGNKLCAHGRAGKYNRLFSWEHHGTAAIVVCNHGWLSSLH